MQHNDPNQWHAGEGDEGQLEKQTPGLDPEDVREEAGPDWPPGLKGDFEDADVVRGDAPSGTADEGGPAPQGTQRSSTDTGTDTERGGAANS